MAKLAEEIAALSPPLKERLAARGFSAEDLLARAATVGADRDERNRVKGDFKAAPPSDLHTPPGPDTPEGQRLYAKGLDALKRGELALCVMAGGMATRMGGVVKALVEALPGKTFLDLRLLEVDHISRLAGRRVPLWLMTSEATCGPIRDALGDRLDGENVAVFEQFVSLRLNPDGTLFRDADGQPDVYPTGHGDLPDALRESGLLQKFIDRGGKYVWIANLDNLGASVDPLLLGWFIEQPEPLMVEVVDKVKGDKGGGPVRYNGRLMIIEDLRFPVGFDAMQVPVFNTNTFLVEARALQDLRMPWTYIEVEKKVDGRPAIQFERLMGEITAGLQATFARVPREGERSRFLPVKDVPELERRRPEIEKKLRAAGILPAESE